MPQNKLKEFLDNHKIKYVTISHSTAYTAQEIAQSAHISGHELAKTVIVNADGDMKMIVLPATVQLNFELLKKTLNATQVELASEFDFKSKFPDCELGAMPPFGKLFGLDVFMTESLSKNKEIAFNACTHTELIKLTSQDYIDLVKPTIIHAL